MQKHWQSLDLALVPRAGAAADRLVSPFQAQHMRSADGSTVKDVGINTAWDTCWAICSGLQSHAALRAVRGDGDGVNKGPMQKEKQKQYLR